jgi:hypothetical protein
MRYHVGKLINSSKCDNRVKTVFVGAKDCIFTEVKGLPHKRQCTVHSKVTSRAF